MQLRPPVSPLRLSKKPAIASVKQSVSEFDNAGAVGCIRIRSELKHRELKARPNIQSNPRPHTRPNPRLSSIWPIGIADNSHHAHSLCHGEAATVPPPTLPPVDGLSLSDMVLQETVLQETVLQETGILEVGDRVTFQDGSLYDEYSLHLSQGQTILITLDSNEFDTYLIVLNHRGDIVATHDDIDANNTNSRLMVTASTDEQYWIVASGFNAQSHGCYHLTVWSTPGDAPAGPEDRPRGFTPSP